MLFANLYLSISSMWQNQFLVFVQDIKFTLFFSNFLASDFVFSNLESAKNFNNHISAVSAVSVATTIHTTTHGIPQGVTNEESCYVRYWGAGIVNY
jgi:hypothetical protein